MLQDPDKRAKAELMFSKLKRAHEVLTDAHARAIYDCLGEAGLAEQVMMMMMMMMVVMMMVMMMMLVMVMLLMMMTMT